MSKPDEIEDVRQQEQSREIVPLGAPSPEEAVELSSYASLRPRHPYVKGPWRRSREADLSSVLVQHSDPED
jgi:hypothetical protein